MKRVIMCLLPLTLMTWTTAMAAAGGADDRTSDDPAALQQDVNRSDLDASMDESAAQKDIMGPDSSEVKTNADLNADSQQQIQIRTAPGKTDVDITTPDQTAAHGQRSFQPTATRPAGVMGPQYGSTWQRNTFSEDSFFRGGAESRQFSRIPPTQIYGYQGSGYSEFPSDADAILMNRGAAWQPMDQVYGYQGSTGISTTGATQGGAVGRVLLENVPEDASSDWGSAKNLVDNNLIQNRDTFDNPRDFYTKEWKVSQPPLVAHTRLQTIYDDDVSSAYYTPWFGSPVTWAPNLMVEQAMPEATNEWPLGDHQEVTYFTGWKEDGTRTTTPASMAWASGMPANTFTATGSPTGTQVYGFRGDEEIHGFQGGSAVSSDGAIHFGRTTLFWDDQDIIGPSASSVGRLSDSVYGFVDPESIAVGGGTPGTTLTTTGDSHLNVPFSTEVNIYGVPGVSEGAAENTGIYGYVESEEKETKDESKQHWWSSKSDECDDDEDADDDDADDDAD